MAIFQPTNTIPSSFTQGTVDAVKDNMEVSWQVNGNSAMTAFQIDFYLNDTASTPVYSTGKITSYSFTNESGQTLSLPFYGTDRFGRPQFFTYNAQRTWAQASMLEANPFTNGNNYKFKITQWYEGVNSVAKCQTAVALTAGNIYYFTALDGAVIYFSVSSNLTAGVNVIYYSYTNGQIWVESGNKIVLCGGGRNADGSIPNGAIKVDGLKNTQTLSELFVVQTSSSDFITRDTPTLILYQTDENYGNSILLPNSLATSIGYFVAKYDQEQDDSIRWIRWQIATASNGVVGDILADTGDIYTPTLNFEFNGFFNENQYAIRCFGESESGQATQLQGANSDGWIFFNINFVANTYDGNFTAQCLNKENATLLKWEGITVIPPTVSPEDYTPTVSNGAVTLLPKNVETGEEYSVTWNKVGNKEGGFDNMSLEPNWTAVWKGKLEQSAPELIGFEAQQRIDSNDGFLMAISIDGKTLAKANYSPSQILLYNILDNGNLTFRGYLKINGGLSLTSPAYGAGGILGIDYSLDGNFFAVSSAQGLIMYDTKEYSLLTSVLTANASGAVKFNSNSRLIAACNDYSSTDHRLNIYIIDNASITQNIFTYQFGEFIPLSLDFNSDGTLLIVGGTFGAKSFLVDGNTVTFYKDILLNGNNPQVFGVRFNKSTYVNMLIMAISATDSAVFSQFNATKEQVELISIISDTPSVTSGTTYAISFSSNGENLLLGGRERVNWYKVANGELIYQNQIVPPNGAIWESVNALCFNPLNNMVAVFNLGSDNFIQTFTGEYTAVKYLPQGKLFSLTDNSNNKITITRQDNPLILKLGEVQLASVAVPDNSTSVAAVVTSTTLHAYFYDNNGLISQSSTPITYTQQPVTSVSIYGGDSGATIDGVSVYDNRENVFDISNYENPNFEPVWNDQNYDLYMTANFNGNLEGGTGTSSGKGFQVYRQEVGKNVLNPIATVSSTTTSLIDYGISSRKAYKYSLYAYDSNSAFMGGVEADNVIATNFKNYSLLVCDYDYDKDEYHVRKQYLFALNLSNSSVGNNNSPTLNANFTQYPTRMPSAQNYASGTLSGLIGAIYTVPALIEQIGQYKYTAKPSTMDYFDSVDLEKELYDLSTAPYQLFLRDMKGRLRMIHTNGAISMTTNIKQKQQSISISFPWVETGDASDVTIIQTPDDYGWNNDNQVLDVQLDVDVATGELSATYPFPYNGTKFYLTGVNKENLTAKTPHGITPAQFNLSDRATQTTDGEVTATVTVNSETNSNNN